MLSSKVMVIYRIIAMLMLSIPMTVNIYIKAGIVSSIIYVPLMTLVFSGIAIFIDGKLSDLLSRGMILPKIKVPISNIHIKTANEIII